MALVLSTAPTEEPLTTAEAKLHLRVDHSDEDTLIDGLITAARLHIEQTVLRRALVTQTWDLYVPAFPGSDELALPKPPLQSVSSVKYTPDGDSQATFNSSNYSTNLYAEPGYVKLNDGTSWPGDVLEEVNGVQVTFVAGYGAAEDVPQPIKQAMLLLIGHLYENREQVVIAQGYNTIELPLGVAWLLQDYRFWPEEKHVKFWYS